MILPRGASNGAKPTNGGGWIAEIFEDVEQQDRIDPMRTEKSVEIRGFDIAEREAITQGLVNRVASESMSIPQT